MMSTSFSAVELQTTRRTEHIELKVKGRQQNKKQETAISRARKKDDIVCRGN